MDQPSSPYAAPVSPVADQVEQPGRPVLAVIAGFSIDIVASSILGFLIGIGYGIALAMGGADESTIQETLTSPTNPVIMTLGTVLGCAISVFAGYCCARIGKRRVYLLGTIQAVLTSAFAVLMMPPESWLTVALMLASIASILLGCHLWQRNNPLTPAAAPASPTQ